MHIKTRMKILDLMRFDSIPYYSMTNVGKTQCRQYIASGPLVEILTSDSDIKQLLHYFAVWVVTKVNYLSYRHWCRRFTKWSTDKSYK